MIQKGLFNITKVFTNEKILNNCDTFKKDIVNKNTNKNEVREYLKHFNTLLFLI